MIGEGVDLAVIQLDRADGLRRWIDRLCFGAKAAEGGLRFVRADPACDRGGGDSAAGFRLQALCGLAERVAQVVERERLEHQADGVGLVAKRGRAGREQALARGAAPELHDLKLFLANAFASDDAATAVRARAGRFVRVRRGGRSKRGAGHKKEGGAESLSQVTDFGRLGHGFWMATRRLAGCENWRVRRRILDGGRGLRILYGRESGKGSSWAILGVSVAGWETVVSVTTGWLMLRAVW